jgi:hypothetical protein
VPTEATADAVFGGYVPARTDVEMLNGSSCDERIRNPHVAAAARDTRAE